MTIEILNNGEPTGKYRDSLLELQVEKILKRMDIPCTYTGDRPSCPDFKLDSNIWLEVKGYRIDFYKELERIVEFVKTKPKQVVIMWGGLPSFKGEGAIQFPSIYYDSNLAGVEIGTAVLTAKNGRIYWGRLPYNLLVKIDDLPFGKKATKEDFHYFFTGEKSNIVNHIEYPIFERDQYIGRVLRNAIYDVTKTDGAFRPIENKDFKFID